MPFYRYIPSVAELEGLTAPLPTVIPVNYRDEQISWAYLQEGGYFFLLEGDFRYMMDRQALAISLALEEIDGTGDITVAALELASRDD